MNPFRDAIVASPWEPTRVDVPEIHGHVFERCLHAVDHVRNGGRSAALLIHGEAGSGKTHLLSRLRARLAPAAPSATGRHETLYVWVRLQTSPRMIWRTLRRTLVDDWFRPVAGMHSQFQRILFHRLAEVRPAEGDLERWYEYMLDQQPDGLLEAMEEIATRLNLDRNTAVAFNHIAFGRHVRELRAWLAGVSLPQAALERIDLAQDEGADEEREDQARQVVLMLCRLAGNGLPIILSFDQVEALQMTPRDEEALFAFGQLISTLHDDTTNALLISCVQSAFATELKDHAREADYARMTSLGAASLDPLSRPQAERLIAAHRACAAEAPAIPAEEAACWPLDRAEFLDLFAAGFVSPRKLLGLCAERFELRGQPDSPAARLARQSAAARVEAFLREQWDATLRWKLADGIPERTEEIIRHGLPLLVALVSPETRVVRDDLLPDVPLVFAGAHGKVGLSVCAQANMTSLAARLKRLKKQHARNRLDRLLVVRDSRLPITATARAAQQYLAELAEQRAVILTPPIETLAALDALRELLSDAKSGDLACQQIAISPETLEQWLAANLADELQQFVGEVLRSAHDERDAPAVSTQSAETTT